MKINWPRLLLSGLLAYVAGFTGFLFLFGNPLSQRLIYSSDYGQSSKLIDIWKSIEPIPPVSPFWDRVTTIEVKAIPVILLLFAWSVGLAWIYAHIHASIPGRGWRKGLWFGFGVWLSSFLFFEIFTPLNLFGEPLHLIAYQLALELVIAAIVGIVIAGTYRQARPERSG